MDVYHRHVWFLRRPKESNRSPGVTGGCEPRCECWGLNAGKDTGMGSPCPSADSTTIPFTFCISTV